MTVHFIGAGPGAPDLITVRGLNLIRRCPVCLYAGSLVPREVIAEAPQGARVVDTAPLTLDEIIGEIEAAHAAGQDIARVHSGDPSLYGAIGEQMRRLDALDIAYNVTPGVPAYAAAAAALKCELTLPEVSQTVVLTRTATRSSPMPDGEELAALGRSGATLAIHLSVTNLAKVVRELLPLYGTELPGRGRLSRRLAGRGVRSRHAGRHPRQGEGGGLHPYGADPRRPGAGQRRFRRQPPLRRRPPSRAAAASLTPLGVLRDAGRSTRGHR